MKQINRILIGLILALAGAQTNVSAQAVTNKMFDFNGDGRADFTVRRDSDRTFYVLNSVGSGTKATQWGLTQDQDVTAVGDFDGDGKADIGVYRLGASEGAQNFFFILRSSTGTLLAQPWGICCRDFLVAGDYDGDGKSDFAVWRYGETPLSPATWHILQSSNNQIRSVQFGESLDADFTYGDFPTPGDYDGDGKTDIGVYRVDYRETPSVPDRNTFYVLRSASNSLQAQQWGNYETDFVTPGDFDGDGKTDFAVWRGFGEGTNGTWYIKQSSNGALRAQQFGLGNSDTPVQKDYDGDGKTDLTVRRDGIYYVLRSSDNQLQVAYWGLSDDFPIATVGNH